MNDPLLSLLGMSRRAGKLVIGARDATEAVKRGKARLVLVSADTAPRTEKELRFFSKETIPVLRLTQTREQISQAIGIAAGTVALTDDGFAARAGLLINGGNNL